MRYIHRRTRPAPPPLGVDARALALSLTLVSEWPRGMARSRTPRDDYEVGYKTPPKATQFRKGQSGYACGRPKKTREPALPAGLLQESARILRLLEEEVSVMVNGRARRVTRGKGVQCVLAE